MEAEKTPPVVDIGIVTIRDDEFRAVLEAFPEEAVPKIHDGRRQYTLRLADAGAGRKYLLAILRQIEQGNGEAQDAARDLIEDLHPSLLLVVGIAGALPSDDISLGDVVLATKVLDYSVDAKKFNEKPTYSVSGGPIAKKIAAAVAVLAAREKDLGDWTASLGPRPAVSWSRKGQIYGPKNWQTDLRGKLEARFGKSKKDRPPRFIDGTIASSDTLVKDPRLLFPWTATARHLLAVEMESGGVYRAARDRCAMLAIRGISDVVGLKRAEAWTKFACKSAAAFAAAYLRTQPVKIKTSRRGARMPEAKLPPAPASAPRVKAGLAPKPHDDFKGREDDLVRIDEALHGGAQVALHSKNGLVAAHGGGGIGKTRLAIEYSHRYAAHYPGGVHRAVAGTRALVAVWADLARAQAGGVADDLTQDVNAALTFARSLAERARGRQLIILDDVQADDLEELAARFDQVSLDGENIWPPDPANVSVLMTTRLNEIPGAKSIPIDRLPSAAARALLIERTGRHAPTDADAAAALELADRVLGGHPLAISLAGAYLRKVGPGVSFSQYTAKVRDKGAIAALEEAAKHAGYRIRDHERSIVATYALSRAQLNETNEIDARAARVFAAVAHLEPAVAIDRRLIARVVRQHDGDADEEAVGLAIARLLELSLLDVCKDEEAEEGDVTIHPLVAQYALSVLAPDIRKQALDAAIDAINELFPDYPQEYWRISAANADLTWEWISQARNAHALAALYRARQQESHRTVSLALKLGDHLEAQGSLDRALNVFETARSIAERSAQVSPDNAGRQRWLYVSYGRIGNVLAELGDREKALTAYRTCLDINQRIVENNENNLLLQRDLSVSHEKIGDMLAARGDAEQALIAYSSSREIIERLLRREPSNVFWQRHYAVSHNKVGDMLAVQGDLELALTAYHTARDIMERLAQSDPSNAGWQRDLSVSHNRIGEILGAKGDRKAAFAMYRGSLAITKQLVQRDPNNVGWKTDLAFVWWKLGGTAPRQEARQLFQHGRDILADLQLRGKLRKAQLSWLPQFDRDIAKLDDAG